MRTRVALVTPFAFPSLRGNAVTVARIAHGLAARGMNVRVWDHSAGDAATMAAEIEAFAPSLVHAFHARHVGPFALRLARRAEIPLVVTLTGTDANHDLFDPEHAATVRRVLEGAARIVVFDPSIGMRVAGVLPDLGSRIVCVPQAAHLASNATFDLAAAWPELPADRLLFAFPAGIRPVKQPGTPLPAFDALAARHPRVRLLYAGPILDPDEGERLLAAIAARAWARYVGAVPHTQMASLLAQSDVVLNCSLSEGGMANSVLEALVCGRPVLAADIEGNRSLVAHDVSGLLFRTATDLEAMAERLVRDEGLRARLAAAGQAHATTHFPPAREIEGYLAVYGALTPVVAE
jgi:glycosyltransferase involved in cell wall biosynthesis